MPKNEEVRSEQGADFGTTSHAQAKCNTDPTLSPVARQGAADPLTRLPWSPIVTDADWFAARTAHAKRYFRFRPATPFDGYEPDMITGSDLAGGETYQQGVTQYVVVEREPVADDDPGRIGRDGYRRRRIGVPHELCDIASRLTGDAGEFRGGRLDTLLEWLGFMRSPLEFLHRLALLMPRRPGVTS